MADPTTYVRPRPTMLLPRPLNPDRPKMVAIQWPQPTQIRQRPVPPSVVMTVARPAQGTRDRFSALQWPQPTYITQRPEPPKRVIRLDQPNQGYRDRLTALLWPQPTQIPRQQPNNRTMPLDQPRQGTRDILSALLWVPDFIPSSVQARMLQPDQPRRLNPALVLPETPVVIVTGAGSGWFNPVREIPRWGVPRIPGQSGQAATDSALRLRGVTGVRGVPVARGERPLQINATTLQPYPDKPAWFRGPLTEWIIWDDLTRRRGFKEGEDFLYQQAIPLPGVYVSKDFFRSDFWILPNGRNGSPGYPYTRGIVLDPVSTFTHRRTGQDRLRRSVLAQGGYRLVWIDDHDLQNQPHQVITLALKGQDVSSIGRGAR